MNSFTIREAQVADARGIATIHVQTWQCAYKGQIPDSLLQSLDIEKRTERWNTILSNPKDNSHTFVAVKDDHVLGFCSVSHNRDDDTDSSVGEIWAIYVAPNAMGKGIGTVLMEKGLTYLREKGFTKATLWVLTSNEKTRKWYESKGWVVEGKTKSDEMKGIALHETRYSIALT